MENVGFFVVVAVLFLVLGAVVGWLVSRVEIARAKAETDQAKAAAEQSRAAAEQARAQVAEVREGAAQGREAIAQANTARAEAVAEAARWEARVTAAQAERDAAITRAEELAAGRDALAKEFKLLSTATLEEQSRKADASAEQRLKATEQLMVPVKESLERFNRRLVEVEKERATMQADLRNHVDTVRRTGDELRRETNALVTALRKPQVRGAWGEMQLKRVAEVAGMLEHCDFVLQETSTTSEDRTIRPDMKVMLGEGKFVYVDSKVPLTSFLDAHEASDEAESARLLESFARNVRTHIDQLASKSYFKADTGTPEFVVLFLPSEALAAEALAQLPDLHEYSARKNVVLATPTTLIAMLRAVAYSWQQAALADSAAEVSDLGRELYDRLSTMGGHFDRLGRALDSSVKAYNDVVGSIESRVLVTARRFRDLKVSDKQLNPAKASEAQARPLVSPELIESAEQATPMIGRELPERDELRRTAPDAEGLVTEPTISHLPQQGRMAK